MTEREEFEVWAISEKLPTLREGDRYSWSDVQDYWIGWQARAALASAPAAQGAYGSIAQRAQHGLDAGWWAPAADVRESVDAARYRCLRETTTKVTNSEGQKVAVTPETMDAAVDQMRAARASKGGADGCN